MIVKLFFAFAVWFVAVVIFVSITLAVAKALEVFWRKLGRDPRAW